MCLQRRLARLPSPQTKLVFSCLYGETLDFVANGTSRRGKSVLLALVDLFTIGLGAMGTLGELPVSWFGAGRSPMSKGSDFEQIG